MRCNTWVIPGIPKLATSTTARRDTTEPLQCAVRDRCAAHHKENFQQRTHNLSYRRLDRRQLAASADKCVPPQTDLPTTRQHPVAVRAGTRPRFVPPSPAAPRRGCAPSRHRPRRGAPRDLWDDVDRERFLERLASAARTSAIVPRDALTTAARHAPDVRRAGLPGRRSLRCSRLRTSSGLGPR